MPYHAFAYEKNPYSLFGIGVPENMDDSQKIMNGHARMAIDNLALSGSLVFDVDESALAGGQSMAMYENDEIDLTGVGLYDLERVLDPNEESNKHLVVAPPSFSVSYIGFNASVHPFKDSKFRQALNHAVDKGLIATEVMSDLIEPAYGILPPGFPGYNPDLQGLRYDPELAQRLLDESYYDDLSDLDKRIVITVPGSGGTIGLDLEVVIEMWRQVLGVEVEIEQVEWATYLEDLNQNKFQAFAGLGWQADYPDPQDFLDILFHSCLLYTSDAADE